MKRSVTIFESSLSPKIKMENYLTEIKNVYKDIVSQNIFVYIFIYNECLYMHFYIYYHKISMYLRYKIYTITIIIYTITIITIRNIYILLHCFV